MAHTPHPATFVEPMSAKVVDTLPEGDRWVYEVKWDGYRALILKEGRKVQIRSRNNKDLTSTYANVRAAAEQLQAESAVIDGEVVALDPTGRPSFQALQHRKAHPDHIVVYYAFDLLQLNGEDLTRLPLEQRRDQLERLLKGSGLLISQSLQGSAAHIVEAVSRLGLEGVVAKRKDSRYDAAQRPGAWLKLKLDRQQEFVVGGYRPGTHGVEALLVGVYDGRSLTFVGNVHGGLIPRTRRDLYELLEPLHSTKCPFRNLPTLKKGRWGSGVTPDEMNEMQWVTPRLVVQIRFAEWTADGYLRHPAFMGIRRDKAASTVRREIATTGGDDAI